LGVTAAASRDLTTPRLRLVLQTREEVRSMIEGMSPEVRAQVSPDWLRLLDASSEPSPWIHGFRVVHQESGEVIGNCGFKGPPTDGMVEIAYGVAPEVEGKGYATEAAQALTDYARTCGEVRIIRAHTLPGGVASQRVLAKCGYQHVGEVIDPEDGLVWRFEWAPG
jgi:[ribosomal protein S5]-alanine N-acetyltransferase